LWALRASDDRLFAEELRLVVTNRQVAIVRTLADELERCLVRDGAAMPALQEQLVQELARLGCRSLETAAAMAEKPVNVAEQSGTHCVVTVGLDGTRPW
jgi:hypothetical protein